MIALLLALPALAVDVQWLGPAAEPAATELEASTGAMIAASGISPVVGARASWSPAPPVTLGASALWIAPTATVSTLGARALLLDREHLRVAAVTRAALATRFDGSLGPTLLGAGLAAETQLGPLRAGATVPLAGLDPTPTWLPGLWDTHLALTLGDFELELALATSLKLAALSLQWRHWQLTLTGNGALYAATLSWQAL